MAVLDCLFNSVSGILRKNVDKKSLCDNMEVIMLAMDEMIDNGMIMESDAQQVISRVALRSDDIPLGEQTVAQVVMIIQEIKVRLTSNSFHQVLQSAKEQLRWSLLK